MTLAALPSAAPNLTFVLPNLKVQADVRYDMIIGESLRFAADVCHRATTG